MESRLEQIETKLTLAEDLLEELNKTVYQQQRRIAQLETEVSALREQMQNTMPADNRASNEEIPPHY